MNRFQVIDQGSVVDSTRSGSEGETATSSSDTASNSTATPPSTSSPPDQQSSVQVGSPTTLAPVILPSFLMEAAQITQFNRSYPGVMFGGWGTHLRGVMRSSADDSLWWVEDSGPSVLLNTSLNYYRSSRGQWSLVGSQPQLSGVQQNTASIMNGGDHRAK